MKVPSKNAKQITTVPQSYWYIFSFFIICCDIFFNLCSFTESYQWILYTHDHLSHHKFVGNLRPFSFYIFLDAWSILNLFRDSVFTTILPLIKILWIALLCISIFLLRLYFLKLKVIQKCIIISNYISHICNIGELLEDWCKIDSGARSARSVAP